MLCNTAKKKTCSPEKKNQEEIHTYIEREILGIDSQTWGAGRSGIYRAGQQPGDSGQSWCYSLEPEDSLEAEFLLLQEITVFALKADWMRPNTFQESPALLRAGWFKGSSHLCKASTATSGGCLNKQLVIIASPSRPAKLTITSFNFQRHIPPSPYRGNYSSSFIISALEIGLTYGLLSPLPFLISNFHPKPQILSLPRNTVSDFPWRDRLTSFIFWQMSAKYPSYSDICSLK